MVRNWQRDPRWKDVILGTKGTIGVFGCTISVIGNIIGVIPTFVNDHMRAVNGFAQGNLVIWDKIAEAFPGIQVRRVWAYNNEDVKKNVPNVIVEVPAGPIGGTGSHWVQYLGNQRLWDPWEGRERPTSDFPNPTGYAVITGKWNESTPPNGGLPPNYADIIRKASNWDEVEKMGYFSVAALKQALDKPPVQDPVLKDKLAKIKTIVDA